MANVKISQLPSLSTMTDASEIPVVSSGTTYKITGSTLEVYFTGNVEFSGTAMSPRAGATESNITLQNGTSAVDILAANGNVAVTAGSSTWTFDTTGNLTIPSDIIGLATIDIDNRASGNSADINLFSADNITLQARDRTLGSGSEGGDINIFAGDSAEDSDTSGGDIVIEAGRGGASNVDFGGNGGFITVQSGQGGAASTGVGDYPAQDGGDLTLRAGDAGSNMGNIARGAFGGDVVIEAGDSTGNLDVGGSINLRTGTGGANAAAGSVIIDIPVSDQGTGGEWMFDATGNLVLPRGGVVYETNIPYGNIGNTIALAPSGGINADQQLLVYPTAGNVDANHLHLTSGNLYNTELFLGDDSLYVKLANTGNVVVNSNDNTGNTAQWTFGINSALTLPGGSRLRPLGSNLDIFAGTGSYVNLITSDESSSMGVDNSGGYITTAGGTWNFGTTGNLTLPGNTFAVNYANGTAVSIGGSSYGDSNVASFLGAFGSNTVSTTGNVTVGNVITGGVVSATGNVAGNNVIATNDVLIGTGNSIVTLDQASGNLRISAGVTNTVIPLTAYSLTAGTDYTTGDIRSGIGGDDTIVRATVSSGWSSNAITAFSVLNTSASNVRINNSGFGFSPVTALANVQYFAGNTSYILTFASAVGVGFERNVSGIEMTVSGTQSVNDNIVLYTGGVANTQVLQITGISRQITAFGAIDMSGGAIGNVSTLSATGNVTGNNFLGTRLITTPQAIANLSATPGSRAFINDSNLAATAGWGTQISGGGSNIVPAWSDGSGWYLG